MGELQLGLEIADRAQATDDRAGAAAAAQLDRQPVERVDLHPVGRNTGATQRLANHSDPSGGVEHGRLAWIGQDGHDQPVEDFGGPFDDIEMAVGDGIERAGIDRDGLHRSSWRR